MLAGAVYSNLEGRDGRSVGLAVASVVPIAVLHSLHNSLIGVGSINGLPPAMETLISLGMLGLAVKAFRTATARSPYRRYPYFRAAEAIPAIRRGLGLNPRSIVLHRRLALYLIAARSYRQALPHLRYCTRRVKHRAMYEAVEGVALLGLARGGGEAAARRAGRRLLERAQHALPGPRRLALEQELRRVIKEPELLLEIYRIFNPPKTVARMRAAPLLRPKPASPRGAVRAGGGAGPAPGPGRLPQAASRTQPGGRRQGTSEIEALRLLWPSYQPAYGPELES
jgi:hypothetical protein